MPNDQLDENIDGERILTEISNLRKDIQYLSKKIEGIEEQLESNDSQEIVHGFTGKEARVLTEIDKIVSPGETVTRGELGDIYRRITNLRQSSTITDHVKDLTKQGPFEFVKPGVWTYTGGDGDE